MNNLLIYFIVLAIVAVLYITFLYKFVNIYYIKNKNFEKRQWVRLLDIFILGPFAIWLAFKIYNSKELSKWISYFLVTYGVGTIIFNLWNYRKNILLYEQIV
jgi:hypothetical protein